MSLNVSDCFCNAATNTELAGKQDIHPHSDTQGICEFSLFVVSKKYFISEYLAKNSRFFNHIKSGETCCHSSYIYK